MIIFLVDDGGWKIRVCFMPYRVFVDSGRMTAPSDTWMCLKGEAIRMKVRWMISSPKTGARLGSSAEECSWCAANSERSRRRCSCLLCAHASRASLLRLPRFGSCLRPSCPLTLAHQSSCCRSSVVASVFFLCCLGLSSPCNCYTSFDDAAAAAAAVVELELRLFFTTVTVAFWNCSLSGLMRRLRGVHGHVFGSEAGTSVESLQDVGGCDQKSMDDASTSSTDDRSDLTGERDLSFSYCHDTQLDESASCSDGSSPLGWPLGSHRDRSCEAPSSVTSSKMGSGHNTFMWEEKREKRETELSEVEMMKERFAKLLLGEDMSGGAKGVSTALAISNAITNLSASLFGELWRLEPLPEDRRTRWRREMEWLLSVSDHIVELVPSWQTFPDGSSTEVMVSRPRSDLHINLPALRKLDAMLLDSLNSYIDTEFWYVDRGIDMAEKESKVGSRLSMQRQEEKWWLPTPKVPVNGLSEDGRRKLQHQREAINQILKAAMAINGQVLLEMEVPDVYWDSLPKNGKSSLGDAIYKHLSSDNLSVEQLLSTVDLSSEHSQVEVANRLETAILVWRRKIQSKHSNVAAKTSWGMMKDLVADENRREQIADKAESMLLSLKLRFPGLPQTALDMNKIQYNKDVGQSILESYSRVLESLAFNIIARIDDILYADDMVKRSVARQPTPPSSHRATNQIKRPNGNANVHTTTNSTTLFTTPFISPITSPILSPHPIPNSPHDNVDSYGVILGNPLFADWPSDNLDASFKKDHDLVKLPLDDTRSWSYAGNLENSNALRSPMTRD